MTECDEVAAAMPTPPAGASLDEVRAIVRLAMPGETDVVIDNVAEALWTRTRPQLMACDECGCTDIQGTTWYELNSGTFCDDGPNDAIWCPQCEAETGIAREYVAIPNPYRKTPMTVPT